VNPEPGTGDLGLYIHVPFCARKCAYCSFFSVAGSGEAERERYVKNVCAEIDVHGKGEKADTVFFGGGTPSLLLPDQIGAMLGAIGKAFHLDSGAEITMEANPETVTPDSLAGYRASGVNRVSFGIQSLDDPALAALGRIHDSRRAREAVEWARTAGFDNVGADMLFGLPAQTPGSWRRDLRSVIELPVCHLSCYELTVEEDTPLAAANPALPDEDAVVEMWDVTREETARAGFTHYEVSNYAIPGRECRHNLKYWQDTEFYGFGPAAWSYRGGVRQGNPRGLEEYYAGAATGFPPAETDDLPAPRRLAEAVMLGLRLMDGCRLDDLASRYGSAAAVVRALEPHVREGRVEVVDGRHRLTAPGLLLANEVWADVLVAD
jgi:oxygen-independent coproporphyrinogen-3 oxidase